MSITQNPPAAAVEKDAHWQAKINRLRDRKPLEVTIVLHDEDAGQAVDEAKTALLHATQAARIRRAGEVRAEEPGISDADLMVRIEGDLQEQPEIVEAQAALAAAQADQEERDTPFTFRALPADVWEELIEAYPPTEKQKNAGQDYNVDRFGPALLSACSVDPLSEQMSAQLLGGEWRDPERPAGDQWVKERAILSQGESSFLFVNAVNVNQSARVSLGKGSRPTSG
jgi:hypothetical protein